MDDARTNRTEASPESLRRQLQAAAVVATYIHEISDRHVRAGSEDQVAEPEKDR
jgi:hypothetical protein